VNRVALWLLVPVLLLAAAVVARLVCRACDAVERPEGTKPKPQSVDEEFAAIVATSTADLEREWRDG
jgi:hypothetical protein